MKVKKGDNVKILIGKDRGKTGKILQVLNPKSSVKTRKGRDVRVVVEGLNLRYKHLRPRRQGEKGQRIMFPAPMNISNIQLICPKCGKPSRIKFNIREDKSEINREKKGRVCKKCNGVF